MSDGDHLLGRPTAESERSLFDGIMGDEPEPQDHGHQGGEEGEGGEPERHDETEAERQDRERDAQGRFAKPDPKGDGRQGQDRRRGEDHRVPVKAVTEERGKRQAAEAERDAERREREADRQEMARLRGMLEQMQRQPAQQTPAPEKQAPAAPDMWTDPEGYRAYVIGQAEQRAQAIVAERDAQRIRFSFEDAGQRHGEAFQAAYRALDALPPDAANLATLNRIKASADPGEALLNWHRAHQARQEIGADPVAYRDRVKAEIADPEKLMQDPAFAAAVTDMLRRQAGQGGPNGGPRTTYTPVPSLNGTRGSNARTASPDDYDGSDRGIFDTVMRGSR